MGVLNVTPDSFSDGGFYLKPETAARRALQMEEEGAHLIDVGGESSRPGSQPVSAKEEIQRIRPVLKILAKKIKIPLSVDTAKYDVALAALDEGAEVINDITALRQDKKLGKLIARYKAGIVLMHMRGTPQTMQTQPIYRDVLKDAAGFLKKAVTRALDAGIARSSIILDPGFGFGKKLEHNLTLLSRFDFFQSLRLPLLAGLSRKSFIGGLLDVPVGERLAGSLAAASVAIHRGAHMLRVHDVRAHRQLCLIIDAALAGREAA
ncbi:MAG: dihydropteroate synthase [Candidatus Omnitrophica bacterium]|nr:dihydropteroate synthase [Candidatus Omnitrophota bacterium]